MLLYKERWMLTALNRLPAQAPDAETQIHQRAVKGRIERRASGRESGEFG